MNAWEEVTLAESQFYGAHIAAGGLPEAIVSSSTALMIIDMQYLDAHRDWGVGRLATEKGMAADAEYKFARLEDLVIPHIRRLQAACRSSGIPLVHVRIMNQTPSGSDTSWRYRQFGFIVPPDSKEAEFLDELKPLPGEIILNKTTSGVFNSTNADFVLRNMGVDTIIMTGVATNNCVETSTRGAADLGYGVILVGDACAAYTQEGHDHTMRHLHRNFATVKQTDQVLDEIAAVGARASGAGAAQR